MTAVQTTQAATSRATVSVPLQTPIERTGETIRTLTIMKPRTGDLRGLLLTDVLQMKADAVAVLLPRISTPTILKHEVDELDPADLVACGMEVANFLVPKAAMESQPE